MESWQIYRPICGSDLEWRWAMVSAAPPPHFTPLPEGVFAGGWVDHPNKPPEATYGPAGLVCTWIKQVHKK